MRNQLLLEFIINHFPELMGEILISSFTQPLADAINYYLLALPVNTEKTDIESILDYWDILIKFPLVDQAGIFKEFVCVNLIKEYAKDTNKGFEIFLSNLRKIH